MDADRRPPRLPSPGDLRLYVERLTEPYSGMPLIGVGGDGSNSFDAFRVDVRTDGLPASFAVPKLDGDRLHFSTQLPFDPTAKRLQVVAVAGTDELTFYDEPLADVGTRTEAVPTTPNRGLVGRLCHSVVTGEVFSVWRWKARLNRLAELGLRVRQKVRNKLLARRFRPCDPHLTCAANSAITPRLRAAMADEVTRFRHTPTFSILVPIYNVDPKWLAAAIESVQAQVYPHWELCLADDASTRLDLLRYLDRLPEDPRITLVRREKNGHICHATNSAADVATGEYIALLDNDDALAPHALFAVARLLQDRPDADVVYSDEDKVDADGRRYDPQFKPDWSPELLLSYNYVNHFTVIRRSQFEKAGRYRPGYEGSQDHDLLLRVTERTDRVYRVPEILYHWRSLPSSTASTAGVKRYVHTAGRKAVGDALARRGIRASLYTPTFADRLGLPILGLDGPDDGPSVAVVIRGEASAAARTVRAVKATTAYRHFTPYLVVDGAPAAESLNRIAAGRTEEFLVFLEAGVEPTDRRWLSRLMAYLQFPGVGAAGGLMRNADGTIASAGTLLGMHDGIAPDDAARGVPKDGISYYFYAQVGRNVSAPGRGLLATRRELFERVGGFDADRFPETTWDVDFALRLAGIGKRCVHVAGAEMRLSDPLPVGERVAEGRVRGRLHEENRLSPGQQTSSLVKPFPSPPTPLPQGERGARTDDPAELLALRHAHGRVRDPYSNPNFSERESFRPSGDTPLSLPAEAKSPAVRCLVAAHNLNSPEGAPRYLSEIVLGLRDRGVLDPVVWSPLGGPGAAVYESVGVPVVVAGAEWSQRFVDGRWTPREWEAAQSAVRKALRDSKAEAVVANTLLTFPAVEAAARAGVPPVWVIHESYSTDVLNRVFPPFARGRLEAAFAMASRVIPASHGTAELFSHWNTRGNFRVLHNGLDPRAFPPPNRPNLRSSRKNVIAVGTVCERKGQHTLVEAAGILARKRSDFAVQLVGMRDGVPYANHVRELIRRHRLENVVFPITECDDARPYFRAADVFVCTSHVETFSRAVLEAEAFGLPLVSTPVFGVPEQVFWGFNALPFDFGDAAGLASHLEKLLENDELRTAMGRKSRAAFENHLDMDEMLDRYEAVILGAARTGPRSRMKWVPPAAARPAVSLRKAG